MKVYTLTLLFLVLICGVATAQEDVKDEGALRPRYGIVADANANIHSAAFTALPGIPNCCPKFTSGFGLAPAIGVLYEQPLSSQLLLSMRAGYSSQSGELTQSEQTFVDIDGQSTAITFDHIIDATLGSVGIEPLVGYRLSERFMLNGGARIGFVIQKDFDQQEKIADDVTRGTFTNGRRTRNEFAGELPDASSIQAALLLGGSYELPLNAEGTLIAAPELLFSLGLTPVVDGLIWSTHAIRGGVALKYSPLPAKEISPPPIAPPVVQPQPPPAPESPALVASITASGVAKDATEQPNVILNVEEFVATQMRPLMNYVFFDDNSAEIPKRYAMISAGQAAGYQVEDLYNMKTLAMYREVLNIIGKRLKDEPNTTITLVGTNSNTGAEKGNTELSRGRAESVRNYLRDVWSIAESRMNIRPRNLPERPSNPENPDGMEENQRVEIYSSSWGVLEPVVSDDTVRKASPPTIRFHTEVKSEAGVRQWSITALQDGKQLKKISGTGSVPATVDWEVENNQETIPKAPGRLFYRLDVADAAGQAFITPTESIPVEQITLQKKRSERIEDVEIDRYSMILFDYNESTLNDANRRIVEAIKKRIKPDSNVKVYGYTDRAGEATYNQKLSAERARVVVQALGVSEEVIQGVGETELLYDNTVPEGRFYSRTVTVVVETPVVEGAPG